VGGMGPGPPVPLNPNGFNWWESGAQLKTMVINARILNRSLVGIYH